MTLESTNDNQILAERLTEVYFYLGKRDELQGQYASAISLFKLAIAFNVFEYVEHRYAFLELENIYYQLKQFDALDEE
jgi:lipoprotein NlpI